MSKILIIGAASCIGASLAASILQNTQHTLVTVDDLRAEKNLNNLQFALSHKRGDRHRFYLTSVSDQHICDKLFELERPDLVVFCKTPEKETYHQSLVKTILCCKKTNTKMMYLYPDSASESAQESYKYGKEVCDSDSARDHVSVVHTCRVYGPRQDVADPITAAMVNVINGSWPQTSLLSDRPREWIYIKDLLSAIDVIMSSSSKEHEYFISSGEVASEHEVAMCIKMISESRDFDFSSHEGFSRADNGAISSLGWIPKYGLRQALEHTLAWYAANDWARKV